MSIAENIFSRLNDEPFSYGTTVSVILENRGKALSKLPTEDYIFSDSSVLRVTHNNVQIIEMLNE